MNARTILFTSATAILLALVSAGCNLKPCEEYELATFSVDVIPYLRVVDSNGNGVSGQSAAIRIRKYHCEGPNHWGQSFEQSAQTDGNGWFYYPVGVQINISNERDYIEIRYSVDGVDTVIKKYYPNELDAQTVFNHTFTVN